MVDGRDMLSLPARSLAGAAVGGLLAVALLALGLRLVVAPHVWLVALACVLGGAALGAAQRDRWLRGLSLLVAATSALVAFTPLMRGPAQALVRRDVPVPADTAALADVDAVAVLSAGATDDGRVAGQGLERMLDGLAWARALGRPLVVSVVRNGLDPTRPPTLDDQQRLAALAGVAPLLAVDGVATTRDEAVRIAATARARGWRRVLVVTSPLHSRRACDAVTRATAADRVRVTCAPAASREFSLDGAEALRGPGDRMRAFGLAVYEALGMAKYRVRGWI
jgi:uncharacterized SAM-binding protein YcdF (DUF218 family)